jgi:hypothetical protein
VIVEAQKNRRIEVESYTLADAQALNTIKNRLREVTRLLDASSKAYPDSLEAHQIKHEVVILLTELQMHGLLPDTVRIAAGSLATRDDAQFFSRKESDHAHER